MSTQDHIYIQNNTTHLTSTTVHGSQVFGEFFSDSEIHVEVLEGGESADLHGPCGRVMDDLLAGLQQTHDLPQGKINI